MSRLVPHYAQSKSAFMCVDLQKVFSTKIANFSNCVFVANRFAALHEILAPHTKLFVTEQYPKAFGNTVPEVKIPSSVKVLSKTCFSCITPEVDEQLKKDNVENVIVYGIEGHACILQTVDDLLCRNKKVFLPVDGIGSQHSSDLSQALKTMGEWSTFGCTLTTSESIVLQIMRDAKDPLFKNAAKLLSSRPPQPF
eukprot:gene12103-8327_t